MLIKQTGPSRCAVRSHTILTRTCHRLYDRAHFVRIEVMHKKEKTESNYELLIAVDERQRDATVIWSVFIGHKEKETKQKGDDIKRLLPRSK